ncbi:thiamine-phosphate pyrophosphorylase [Hydrogenivirga caldilitoris]|uniref:Thiamine-phosphate synthase n=1 Tax=Hydrogenivirga caldilitoris TaxID=246264 RepID=A0A497XQI9_9AQUI|nr:thiamine phosphate synthase [Hydrogenivirga caldilitoris]RLJ70399.1 thiamine-phosphate pyrophosphorylase [Hydrogenivirga caldilitoris]
MRTLPRLYAITDRRRYGANFLETVETLLKKGIKMIQLREKDLKGRELYELALKTREITKKYNSLLLINERFDIAVAVEADGVHLPEESFPPGIIKRLFPELLVGYSAHSLEGVKYAEEEGADFVTFGPIFKTQSHPEAKPLGTLKLKEVSEQVNIPIYALGGVTWERIKQCYKNGAYGVAGITMFLQDGDERADT